MMYLRPRTVIERRRSTLVVWVSTQNAGTLVAPRYYCLFLRWNGSLVDYNTRLDFFASCIVFVCSIDSQHGDVCLQMKDGTS